MAAWLSIVLFLLTISSGCGGSDAKPPIPTDPSSGLGAAAVNKLAESDAAPGDFHHEFSFAGDYQVVHGKPDLFIYPRKDNLLEKNFAPEAGPLAPSLKIDHTQGKIDLIGSWPGILENFTVSGSLNHHPTQFQVAGPLTATLKEVLSSEIFLLIKGELAKTEDGAHTLEATAYLGITAKAADGKIHKITVKWKFTGSTKATSGMWVTWRPTKGQKPTTWVFGTDELVLQQRSADDQFKIQNRGNPSVLTLTADSEWTHGTMRLAGTRDHLRCFMAPIRDAAALGRNFTCRAADGALQAVGQFQIPD